MHKKKHYPLMPGKESPHTIMVRIPKYEYEALKTELSSLKEAQRWRKYSKELPPQEKCELLVRTVFGEIDTDCYSQDALGFWHFTLHGIDVTHWMPMPKAPEADK